MTTNISRHEKQFTGRGGAGNYVIKNPIPAENLPKQYSAKPQAGNATGRGGAGNFTSAEKHFKLPEAPVRPPMTPQPPTAYKGGRGGAGNIEAVHLTEKRKEDRELDALERAETGLSVIDGLPREPSERPILRID